MHRLIIIVLFFIQTAAFSQSKITWQTLSDVRFTEKYSKEAKGYYYYPHFGESVKELEGKEVYLKGYILVIDPNEDIYILSQNPYAACFFCGSGGPESIAELKLKPNHPRFRTDQIVTFKGKLKLNQDDIFQCNYILEEAELYVE